MRGGWLVLAVSCLACGSPCERRACKALNRSASASIETGIAGTVASESDVVANGCQECSFGRTSLEVRKTDALVATTGERDAALDTPGSTVIADGSYEFSLEPGFYLVCNNDAPCVSFEQVALRLTTLHVKQVFGPPRFVAFTTTGRTEVFDFSVLEFGDE